MTRFSRVLQELLNEHNLSQTGLAAQSGVDQVKISRLINSQARVGKEDFQELALAFPDPQERFRLAIAHIADELPADIFKLLDIQLVGTVLHDAPPLVSDALPPHIRIAVVAVLAAYPENPALGDIFVDLARAMRPEE